MFNCLCSTRREWPCDFPPKNLELHFGCHTCWLSYFTLVSLWCRLTDRLGQVTTSHYQIFLPTVLRCEWESPANTGNKQKRKICDHKVQPECLHKATFTNTFHLFFLLFPTTLYKKRYDVTVLVNEFLFSYHSQLRMPLAWSRGDEVSVFSSTQVLKEDPFCLNPVHSLYTEKVN